VLRGLVRLLRRLALAGALGAGVLGATHVPDGF